MNLQDLVNAPMYHLWTQDLIEFVHSIPDETLRFIMLKDYSDYIKRQDEVKLLQEKLKQMTGFDPQDCDVEKVKAIKCNR